LPRCCPDKSLSITSNPWPWIGESLSAYALFTSARPGYCMQTGRNPQNWKYTTHCNAVRGGPSHVCAENLIKFGHLILSYAGGQTDRHTLRYTDIQTCKYYRNISQPFRERGNPRTKAI